MRRMRVELLIFGIFLAGCSGGSPGKGANARDTRGGDTPTITRPKRELAVGRIVVMNDADEEAFGFLREFYTGYMTTWEDFPTDEKKADSVLAKYCDASLLSEIKRKTVEEELDYDPFLKAQDVLISNLKTFSVARDARKAGVYTFSYGTGSERRSIHLVVDRRDGRLKIREVW
jgi:hypothetical protein